MNYLYTSLIAVLSLVGIAWNHSEAVKPPSLGASQTISSLTAYTNPQYNDVLPIVDTANGTTKKISWASATSSMLTEVSTRYSPIFSTSAGLAGLLSDETGSSGGFVRATGPTVSSLTVNTSFAGSAVVGIANGGTGSTTKADALNALLPSQVGNSGATLTTNGTNASWGANPNPAGIILAYASTTAPSGYLLCDGTAVSRSTYSALFAVIGVGYGAGDGSTTFNLPDLRGRNVIMASSTLSLTIAGTGGEKTHTQTVLEMPAHTHDWSNSQGYFGSSGAVPSNITGPGPYSSPSAGGGQAFNVMDPYLVMNYIIKT